MKNVILLAAFCCFVSTNLHAQKENKWLTFGLRAGISTSDISADDLMVINSDSANELGLSIKEAKYGIHFGAMLRIGHKFYVEPGLYFNSNTVDFSVEEVDGFGNTVSTIRSESYQDLDIPLLFGLKFGPIRLNAGPVGHVHINSNSDLIDIDGYEQKFEDMTFGWQGGLGVDLWRLSVDLKYEGNFSKFGEHIHIYGQDLNFSDTESRFLLSVGYNF